MADLVIESPGHFPHYQPTYCVLILFCEWITTIFKVEWEFEKQKVSKLRGQHGLSKVLETETCLA